MWMFLWMWIREECVSHGVEQPRIQKYNRTLIYYDDYDEYCDNELLGEYLNFKRATVRSLPIAKLFARIVQIVSVGPLCPSIFNVTIHAEHFPFIIQFIFILTLKIL